MPNYSGKHPALNPLMELEAGAQLRAEWPAQPRAPALEPPQGVKEAGRQVKCAAF